MSTVLRAAEDEGGFDLDLARREGVTADEVAKAVGVSRVTAWRYLERLVDDGTVARQTEYGKTGRPSTRYGWR